MNDRASEAKLNDILHPDTQAREFSITVVFGRKPTSDYEKALEIARRNPTYTEEGDGEWIRHSACYTKDEVDELFDLFSLVHSWDTTEILVNHKRIPYGHQLWIPLMWFYRNR